MQHSSSKSKRVTYINTIAKWWPPKDIAACLGVPGFTPQTPYNYIIFTFWLTSGPYDIVKLWSDPLHFLGSSSPFGSTKDQIQKNIKKLYNDAGIKLLISAFGGTDFPTSAGRDPILVATSLGQFVRDNNLDGVDIDWEDNQAMNAGTGQQWLIKFQTRLREILPNHIITHSPQAPYFKKEHYKNGAYMSVHQKVGKTIDFYNVQFYNQGSTPYDSYQGLFQKSTGYFTNTSVQEIVKRGIPPQKIVLIKPATQKNVVNTGWVDSQKLGEWSNRAAKEMGRIGGLGVWQYASDTQGQFIRNACGQAYK